jgi:hypothetical protein
MLALLLCAHAAAAAAAAPTIAWPSDGDAGACPIAYSQRFSHGGGCDEASVTDPTSPHKYCHSAGKQRAVVTAASAGPNCVHIPWRRYDDPARHDAIVTDAHGATVASSLKNASATVGEVCFTAASAGTFVVYFLPFRWAFGGGSGSYCAFFLGSNSTDAKSHGAAATAVFVRFESKTAFDTRSPMELVASTGEVSRMLASATRKDYLTFPTAITNATLQSLRLDALPISLAEHGPSTTVAATGSAGQYIVIQIAVFALDAIENLTVGLGGIGKIPASSVETLLCPRWLALLPPR